MSKPVPYDQWVDEALARQAEWLQRHGSMYPPKDPVDVPGVDRGIRYALAVLRAAGVETYQSCEGGVGHSFLEPTIQFHGEPAEGFRALAVALTYDLPVNDLRRAWSVQQGEALGPTWEITFHRNPVIPKCSVAGVDVCSHDEPHAAVEAGDVPAEV